MNLDSILKEELLPKSDYKAGKSKEEVASGTTAEKIYKLSSNENILGSSPKALEAIRSNIDLLNEYCEYTDIKLRNALADFYREQSLSPDQFFTHNSAVALLGMIEQAFLNKGDEIIITNPSFKPYAVFAEKMGAKVLDVKLLGDEFHLDIPALKAAINDKTRLIFLTSPNNPTGSYIPRAQFDQIVEFIPDHVILVFDEVYFQFVDVDDNPRAYEYLNSGKNIIGVNSFSKAYGLAGLRVGYAYSSEKIARYVSQLQAPFPINTLTTEASIAALKDTDFINRTVELVHKEKAYIYNRLEEIGIKYWKTQANFITIRPNMDEYLFEELMLKEGVMVRPVANFGAPGCIRVTIGDREANDAYLKALAKIHK